MKSSLRNTLRDARSLQAQYSVMGAPSTQNIRNPLPLHELILIVLPELPHPNGCISVERKLKFTVGGKTFIKKQMTVETVKSLVPASTFKNNGRTAAEVIQDLQNMGYIVHPPSVTAALVSLKSRNKISGVNGDRINSIGRPPMKYFATK